MMLLLDAGPTAMQTAAADLGGFVEIGQLLSPLTRYKDHGMVYGIDNGAFSGFDPRRFRAILARQAEHKDRCRFVAAPDVVGSSTATAALFQQWSRELAGWPLALVAQDGLEPDQIPWAQLASVFIGGSTSWKLSRHAAAIVLAAKARGKWAHIGRVNTRNRWEHFEHLGADSADGSGLARYSWMRRELVEDQTLWSGEGPRRPLSR